MSSSQVGQCRPPVRGLGEPLGVARQVGQAGDHVPADLVERGSPAGLRLQHHDAADVHVGALVDLLELEEGRVEGGELLAHDPTAPPRGVEHHAGCSAAATRRRARSTASMLTEIASMPASTSSWAYSRWTDGAWPQIEVGQAELLGARDQQAQVVGDRGVALVEELGEQLGVAVGARA